MQNISFFLSGRITQSTVAEFIAFLQGKALYADAITILIKSGGGNVSDAIAIAKIIESIQVEEKTTINISNVDSAANIVFAAGTNRLSVESGLFYLHSVQKELNGVFDSTQLRHYADEIDQDFNRIVDYLCVRTGEKSQVWRDYMSRGVLINSFEAINLGLATAICDGSTLSKYLK